MLCKHSNKTVSFNNLNFSYENNYMHEKLLIRNRLLIFDI